MVVNRESENWKYFNYNYYHKSKSIDEVRIDMITDLIGQVMLNKVILKNGSLAISLTTKIEK